MKREIAEFYRAKFEAGFNGLAGDVECWPWRLGVGKGGKAILRGTPSMLAVNLAWVLEGREIPKGHRIVQTCGNDLCVNPGHLKAVTGRIKPAWNGKVGKERAAAIRAEYSKGMEALRAWYVRQERAKTDSDVYVGKRPFNASVKALAERYGLAYGTVHGVLANRIWVDPENPWFSPISQRTRKYKWK